MPELAALIAIGATMSVLTGIVIYICELRKYKSFEFVNLEKNLQQIDKRWNDLNKTFEVYAKDGKKIEVNKQINTILTITFVAMLLSWLGFFFYLLIYLSIKKLGRNRLSDKVFDSVLVQKNLPADQVQTIVDQICQ